MVNKYFAPFPAAPEVKPVVVMPAILKGDRCVSYTDNYAKLPLLMVQYPTVPNYNKDMGALACLSQVLRARKNSILYQQLVKKKLALQASSFSNLSELAGEFTIQMVPSPGKTWRRWTITYRNALILLKPGRNRWWYCQIQGSGMEAQRSMASRVSEKKLSQLAASRHLPVIPNKVADPLKCTRP